MPKLRGSGFTVGSCGFEEQFIGEWESNLVQSFSRVCCPVPATRGTHTLNSGNGSRYLLFLPRLPTSLCCYRSPLGRCENSGDKRGLKEIAELGS